ncbi:Uncharacterised protein [uncultured archaeon]|nr:Uncharacterised protein [uncultured archaeon]
MSISHTRSSRVALKGGQASVELISYASFFFLVFMAAVAIFFQIQGQEMSRAEYANAQEIANGLADRIHTAFVAGPGFEERFFLSRSLLNRPYTLSVTSGATPQSQQTGFVYVEWQGASGPASYSAVAIATNYTATTQSGFISFAANRIAINASQGLALNISNENGTIRFKPG